MFAFELGFFISHFLSLLLGQSSGLCIDSGYSVTHAVPVNDGMLVSPFQVDLTYLGGKHVNQQLQKLLTKRGYYGIFEQKNVDTEAVLDDIKESLCFVAKDIRAEKAKWKSAFQGLPAPLKNEQNYFELLPPELIEHILEFVRPFANFLRFVEV